MGTQQPQQQMQIYVDPEDYIEAFKTMNKYMKQKDITFKDVDAEQNKAIENKDEFDSKTIYEENLALILIQDIEEIMRSKINVLLSPANDYKEWKKSDFIWDWVKEEVENVETKLKIEFSKKWWLDFIFLSQKLTKGLLNAKRTMDIKIEEQINFAKDQLKTWGVKPSLINKVNTIKPLIEKLKYLSGLIEDHKEKADKMLGKNVFGKPLGTKGV